MDLQPAQAPRSMGFPRRILEWVAISFSRESSRFRDQTHVSRTGRHILYRWAAREAHTKKLNVFYASSPSVKSAAQDVCHPFHGLTPQKNASHCDSRLKIFKHVSAYSSSPDRITRSIFPEAFILILEISHPLTWLLISHTSCICLLKSHKVKFSHS